MKRREVVGNLKFTGLTAAQKTDAGGSTRMKVEDIWESCAGQEGDISDVGSNKTKEPWLDINGNLLSDEELKERSKAWAVDVWERFLSRTVDVAQREEIVSPSSFERFSAIDPSTLWDSAAAKAYPESHHRAVQKSLRNLSNQQARIIRLVFWRGMSSREVAKNLGVCRSLVVRQKWNSLRKLKRLSQNYVSTQTIGKGREKFERRNSLKTRARRRAAKLKESAL